MTAISVVAHYQTTVAAFEGRDPSEEEWPGQLSPLLTRYCADCANSVHDTAAMTDHDLIDFLIADPHASLKVAFTQANRSVRPR